MDRSGAARTGNVDVRAPHRTVLLLAARSPVGGTIECCRVKGVTASRREWPLAGQFPSRRERFCGRQRSGGGRRRLGAAAGNWQGRILPAVARTVAVADCFFPRDGHHPFLKLSELFFPARPGEDRPTVASVLPAGGRQEPTRARLVDVNAIEHFGKVAFGGMSVRVFSGRNFVQSKAVLRIAAVTSRSRAIIHEQ